MRLVLAMSIIVVCTALASAVWMLNDTEYVRCVDFTEAAAAKGFCGPVDR